MKSPLHFLLAAAGSCSVTLGDISLPPGGLEMSAESLLTGYSDSRVGRADQVPSIDGEHKGMRITIHQPDPAKGYLAQISIACPNGALNHGDKVLAIVKARVTHGNEGTVGAKLQLAAAPYTEAAPSTSISLNSAWTEFPMLFVIETPIPEGKAGFSLFCAQAAQTVEVASIRVVRYPPDTDVSNFPRIRRTYSGREADAPWRKSALERIEKTRKADCTARLIDPAGNPLANTPVKIRLRRHEFGFGSATPASLYVRDDDDGRRYRDIIDRLFSIVVFENDLKDMWWGQDTPETEKKSRRRDLDSAFQWLGERNIAVRGHYLMQVAIPRNTRNMDDVSVRRHFMETARQRIGFAGKRVCEWDAINHPVAWGGAPMFSKRPGLEHLDREVLALARSLTQLPMFVNEDQLFRPGPQSDGTFEYLARLKQDGIKVDGLGNQAHLHESYLPSPEHILAVTDRFAKLVPRQSITEYDLQTVEDEELAADYTRDILIACFSHPAYSSFLLWGFWEGSHWEPTAASWKKDWTILKRGEVLEEWLGKRWSTELTLVTDNQGTIQWRGFPGWYEVAPVAAENRKAKLQVTMKNPSSSTTLPPG